MLVKPGERVAENQPLLQLSSPELELEVARLEASAKLAQQEIDNLELLRFSDPSAADRLETAFKVREGARRRSQRNAASSKCSPSVLPSPAWSFPRPPAPISKPKAKAASAPWTGAPLDRRNLGALLAPTDLVCQIGEPEMMEAVLVVDQSYIDLVRVGQPVRVLLDAMTYQALSAKVDEIATTELKAVSPGMSSQKGGRLETVTEPSGMTRPPGAFPIPSAYLFGNRHRHLQVGMQGQGRIYTGWQPLGRRLYRYLTKTFHFDL